MTFQVNESRHETLQDRQVLIADLLRRLSLVEDITQRQCGANKAMVEQLVHRQNLAELGRHVVRLSPAEAARVLESLSVEDRNSLWALCYCADILVRVPVAVRKSLLSTMDRTQILAVARGLDGTHLAELALEVSEDLHFELLKDRKPQDRQKVLSMLCWPQQLMTALMAFDRHNRRAAG